ncbi:MAG TPA: MBL fold metallo-hydrolase [Bacteroidetes bacterium]|jgi:phosphoribosyl 1,2-cyclic phosphodiesterase|nr:MBL fold metallo-hydrolase [Bacteroidota bacterium]
MKLKFWGTRGSIPTPGEDTVRYGGNTPCVEVRLSNNDLIILDAGTGIRALGDQLMATGASVQAYIAISHPHWDHVQGFPFFKPAFISGNELTIIGPQSKHVTLRQMMAHVMDKVYFPIQLHELKANIKFIAMKEESTKVFDATLSSLFVNHSSMALGYRVDVAGHSLVYISDNEPFDREVAMSVKNVDPIVVRKFSESKAEPNQRVFDFAKGADVLIHDATYTPEEYVNHVGWGHSHYLFCLKIAHEAGVKKLVLFHHDQTHDDAAIDDILHKCKREIKTRNYRFECHAAAEGVEMEW